MLTLTPLEAHFQLCSAHYGAGATIFAVPQDHHFTGPSRVQQSENHGSVFYDEGLILFDLALTLGGPVLEVGADLGISTRFIHEGLEKGGHAGPLYSVDIYHKWDDDTGWPLRRRVDQSSWTYEAPEKCAWAFIDGDHRAEAVSQDIDMAIRNGIDRLVFHDTSPVMPKATSPSAGSDARDVILEKLKDWNLWDITSKCGMIYAYR